MQPRLLIISGSLTGTVRPLLDGHITIALDESNQLCLIDSDVSRKHCTIEQVDDGFVIVDRDSPCGTFVNGIPISRKGLAHGDAIRIGRSELVFLVHKEKVSETTQICLSDIASATSLQTKKLEDRTAAPTFADRVGWMARDLTALLRICNIFNSIRDFELLQR